MPEFSGKFGPFSAYKRKDSDKTIIRSKGGPSAAQVKEGQSFQRTRENYREFAACTTFTAALRRATFPIRHLGDTKFTGSLNSLGKKIQVLDAEGLRGERSIFLSKHAGKITGFSFNTVHAFDTVVCNPVAVSANRKEGRAQVTIPPLLPGVQLHLPWEQQFYRFVLSLGTMGDVVFENGKYSEPAMTDVQFCFTAWYHVTEPMPETIIDDLRIQGDIPASMTLLLCVGIEMGTPDRFKEITTARDAGTAKILLAF
ncbi:hypothetical protein EGT74_15890 [Chitinophaga lutea]|uniref:Uncharacterized protein n=2 Tax=Chitinophaga lutea TaxID=2488634 RepID=A0A3N4PIJ5_9BACT|nr:hypothetical protein EGT74_15890 [Chitinophaga lutea]